MRACAEAWRAEACPLYLFVSALGSGEAAVLGGVFYTHWDWLGVCGFVGVLTVAGGAIAWRLGQRVQPGTAALALSR